MDLLTECVEKLGITLRKNGFQYIKKADTTFSVFIYDEIFDIYLCIIDSTLNQLGMLLLDRDSQNLYSFGKLYKSYNFTPVRDHSVDGICIKAVKDLTKLTELLSQNR